MKNTNLKGPTNSKAATSTTRTEKDNKLAFLDNAVLRKPEGPHDLRIQEAHAHRSILSV